MAIQLVPSRLLNMARLLATAHSGQTRQCFHSQKSRLEKYCFHSTSFYHPPGEIQKQFVKDFLQKFPVWFTLELSSIL